LSAATSRSTGFRERDEFLMPTALHAASNDLAFKDVVGSEWVVMPWRVQ
jgi:hypothetical protein